MKELKHIQTFERFDTAELNEGFFSSLTTDIEKFLEDPTDVQKSNKILAEAFARPFSVSARLKNEVLSLPIDQKVDILEQCLEVKKDPKIGYLTIQKRGGKFLVGGTGVSGNVPGVHV